jgi:hypothetical protein
VRRCGARTSATSGESLGRRDEPRTEIRPASPGRHPSEGRVDTALFVAGASRRSAMPERKTIQRARQAKRRGRRASTQAGEFVREEMHHVREGKHGARSTKQAIAIGLSKARRAGVALASPRQGRAKAKTRRSAASALRAGRRGRRTPSRTRARDLSRVEARTAACGDSRGACTPGAAGRSAARPRGAEGGGGEGRGHEGRRWAEGGGAEGRRDEDGGVGSPGGGGPPAAGPGRPGAVRRRRLAGRTGCPSSRSRGRAADLGSPGLRRSITPPRSVAAWPCSSRP